MSPGAGAGADAPAVVPSADDELVRAASEVVGGPLGRHAHPAPASASPAAPLLVLGATGVLALAVLTRVPCRATGWASPGQFTRACYSDVASRVASGTVADSPPGAALAVRALAAVAPSARGAFDASVLLGAAATAVAVAALVLLTGARRRPWDAAALALSPVLLVAGLVSVELLAVAAVALGLLARLRGRAALAGAALAVAASVDPFALAVLLAVVVAAAAGGRGREAVASALGAAVALAAMSAAWVVSGLAGEVLGGAPGRSPARALVGAWLPGWAGEPGYGSAWLLPSLPPGAAGLPAGVVVAGAALGTAGAVVVVVLLARRWARRAAGSSAGAADPVAPLALVALAGALLVAPAVPVQSSLLLLPLVAACGLRWREHLPWALADAAAGAVTWLYVYGQQVPGRGAEPWVYALLLLARLAGVAWLALAAVRAAERPTTPGSAPVDDGRAGAASPVVLVPAR